MDPVCFYIGSKAIYWYGVMLALGFLAAVVHLTVLGMREGRPAGFGSDAALWMMLAGILGARTAYVIVNFDLFSQDYWAMIRIDQGGLVFYGGFVFAVLAGVIFSRLKKISFWAFADYIVSALPIGHAFGRLGCLLNGCCYGKASDLPWALDQQEASRHPVQLYEALFNILVYFFLLYFYPRRRREGEVLAVYCMIYAAGRFSLEFLRGDERPAWHGFYVAQIMSAALFVFGAAVWVWILKKGRKLRSSRLK
jgi:phosphatidylglycerol:prolipoprotein diacylglycerol transferase